MRKLAISVKFSRNAKYVEILKIAESVKMNEFTTQVSHKRFGEFWRYSPILNFSSSKSKAGPGILRGQDTIPILSELGFTSDEIDTFKTDGVIDWEEIQPFAE